MDSRIEQIIVLLKKGETDPIQAVENALAVYQALHTTMRAFKKEGSATNVALGRTVGGMLGSFTNITKEVDPNHLLEVMITVAGLAVANEIDTQDAHTAAVAPRNPEKRKGGK